MSINLGVIEEMKELIFDLHSSIQSAHVGWNQETVSRYVEIIINNAKEFEEPASGNSKTDRENKELEKQTAILQEENTVLKNVLASKDDEIAGKSAEIERLGKKAQSYANENKNLQAELTKVSTMKADEVTQQIKSEPLQEDIKEPITEVEVVQEPQKLSPHQAISEIKMGEIKPMEITPAQKTNDDSRIELNFELFAATNDKHLETIQTDKAVMFVNKMADALWFGIVRSTEDGEEISEPCGAILEENLEGALSKFSTDIQAHLNAEGFITAIATSVGAITQNYSMRNVDIEFGNVEKLPSGCDVEVATLSFLKELKLSDGLRKLLFPEEAKEEVVAEEPITVQEPVLSEDPIEFEELGELPKSLAVNINMVIENSHLATFRDNPDEAILDLNYVIVSNESVAKLFFVQSETSYIHLATGSATGWQDKIFKANMLNFTLSGEFSFEIEPLDEIFSELHQIIEPPATPEPIKEEVKPSYLEQMASQDPGEVILRNPIPTPKNIAEPVNLIPEKPQEEKQDIPFSNICEKVYQDIEGMDYVRETVDKTTGKVVEASPRKFVEVDGELHVEGDISAVPGVYSETEAIVEFSTSVTEEQWKMGVGRQLNVQTELQPAGTLVNIIGKTGTPIASGKADITAAFLIGGNQQGIKLVSVEGTKQTPDGNVVLLKLGQAA